mmetsp:Transcript_7970/g.27061  ORF Transcript_7970/g.27061 Transcript_7970/m.27061 type:complete len:328 (-) Transcript_7970:10-993(-)
MLRKVVQVVSRLRGRVARARLESRLVLRGQHALAEHARSTVNRDVARSEAPLQARVVLHGPWICAGQVLAAAHLAGPGDRLRGPRGVHAVEGVHPREPIPCPRGRRYALRHARVERVNGHAHGEGERQARIQYRRPCAPLHRVPPARVPQHVEHPVPQRVARRGGEPAVVHALIKLLVREEQPHLRVVEPLVRVGPEGQSVAVHVHAAHRAEDQVARRVGPLDVRNIVVVGVQEARVVLAHERAHVVVAPDAEGEVGEDPLPRRCGCLVPGDDGRQVTPCRLFGPRDVLQHGLYPYLMDDPRDALVARRWTGAAPRVSRATSRIASD